MAATGKICMYIYLSIYISLSLYIHTYIHTYTYIPRGRLAAHEVKLHGADLRQGAHRGAGAPRGRRAPGEAARGEADHRGGRAESGSGGEARLLKTWGRGRRLRGDGLQGADGDEGGGGVAAGGDGRRREREGAHGPGPAGSRSSHVRKRTPKTSRGGSRAASAGARSSSRCPEAKWLRTQPLGASNV